MRNLLAVALLAASSLCGAPPYFTLQTLQLSWGIGDPVWDSTRSRFLVAVDTSILTIDPERAVVENTLAVGEPVGPIAISDDGQFLYASLNTSRVIRRYRTRDNTLDLEFSLGYGSQGDLRIASALAVAPGKPRSLVVAFAYSGGPVTVYNDAKPLSATGPGKITSMYVRPGGNAIYAYEQERRQMHTLEVDSGGLRVTRTVAANFAYWTEPCWSGKYATDRGGRVFDLDAQAITGRTFDYTGERMSYDSVVNAAGTSVLAWMVGGNAELLEISLSTLRPSGRAPLTPEERQLIGPSSNNRRRAAWGANGFVSITDDKINFIRIGAFEPFPEPAPLVPVQEFSGVIRVPLPATALAYDQRRDLVWAAASDRASGRTNTLQAIRATTGEIVKVIDTRLPVTSLAISGDGSWLYALHSSTGAASAFNAETLGRTAFLQPEPGAPAGGLATVSGEPNAMVVLWAGATVTAYDNGVARPRSVPIGHNDPQIGPMSLSAIGPADINNSFYGAGTSNEIGNTGLSAFRMTLQSDGVVFGKQIPSTDLSSARLVFAGGLLFTGSGQILSSDAQQVLGTFPFEHVGTVGGIPVPFPESGRVAYFTSMGSTGPCYASVFDVSTQRVLSTAKLPACDDTVRAGASVVAVAAGEEIHLVPLASLTPWLPETPAMENVSPGVRRMRLKVTTLVGRPATSELVLAAAGSAGALGNNVAVLDASSGEVRQSVFAGSGPEMLRLTRDGSAAYVYLSGEKRVARIDLAAGARDLVFAPDPIGKGAPTALADMVVGPNEALTTSYSDGRLATFDRGALRPKVNMNTEGPGAHAPTEFHIVLNDSGTIAYALDVIWSSPIIKRMAIRPDGVHYLSAASALAVGRMSYANGLIYVSSGRVIDGERSRLVGVFDPPQGIGETHIALDLPAGRIYAISGNALAVYDSSTYNRIAQRYAGPDNARARSLVRYGADGLAFHTDTGEIYFVDISSIPLLETPIVYPQPTLPSTEGVSVVGLDARDLAYDSGRDLLYASIPDSDGTDGNRIVALSPATGTPMASWSTRINPNLLTMSGDGSRLFFTSGRRPLNFWSGFSPEPEQIASLDLDSDAISAPYPEYVTYVDASFSVSDMVALPGPHAELAVIDALHISSGGGMASLPYSLRVYAAEAARPRYLLPHTFMCGWLAAGADPSELYCSDGVTISRLAVDVQGVSLKGSFKLLPGRGEVGRMVYHQGRIYTTTGLVVDAQAGRVLRRVANYGQVAVADGRVFWLEPSFAKKIYTLHSYDVQTLLPLSAKTINVSATDATRLVPCGNGRLAFRAGKEVYIVHP